jgi:transcriptional regulator with XRE-family HTH domain
VNDLLERLKKDLAKDESRYAYADSVASAFITAQIESLRKERGLTQEDLAELVGTKQSGISRWQSSGYASCKLESLRKFAKAFGVRLKVSFEEFNTLPTDISGFTKERLAPRRFEDDPVFNPPEIVTESEPKVLPPRTA